MKTWKLLIIIYTIALIPRVLFSILCGEAPLNLDEIEYDRLAWSLAEGRGYTSFFDMESTFSPPGYPLFLAAIYYFIGIDYVTARIIQSLVTATIAPLTYLIAISITTNKRAIIAAIITATFPILVMFSFTLMSENIFIPLLLLSIYLTILLIKKISYTRSVSLAISLTGLVFTRSELIILTPILLGAILIYSSKTKGVMSHICIIVAIISIPTAAWSYRNYTIIQQFIFLDSKAGINLNIAFNPASTGQFEKTLYNQVFTAYLQENIKQAAPTLNLKEAKAAFIDEWLAYKHRIFPNHLHIEKNHLLPDTWMNNYGKQQALSYLQENPEQFFLGIPKKFMNFWNLDHRTILFGYSHNMVGKLPSILLTLVLFTILVPFALITFYAIYFITTQNLTKNHWIILIPIVLLAALHSITFADPRFHYPLIPLLSILACCSFTQQSNNLQVWSACKFLCCFLWCLAVFIWGYGFYEKKEQYKIIFSENGHKSYLEY